MSSAWHEGERREFDAAMLYRATQYCKSTHLVGAAYSGNKVHTAN